MSDSWYVKRAGRISGPFPGAVVDRFAGGAADEVSADLTSWQSLAAWRRAMTAHPVSQQAPAPAASPAGPEGARNRRAIRGYLRRVLAGDRRRILGLLAFSGLLAWGIAIGIDLADPETQRRACAAPAAPGIDWNECRLPGAALERANLDGAHLRGIDLSRSRLLAARLRLADLAYARLEGANLAHADLRRSDLRGANLRGADLTYTRLDLADLAYADLRGASLGGVVLDGARLDHAIWVDGTRCAVGSVASCAVPAAPALDQIGRD